MWSTMVLCLGLETDLIWFKHKIFNGHFISTQVHHCAHFPLLLKTYRLTSKQRDWVGFSMKIQRHSLSWVSQTFYFLRPHSVWSLTLCVLSSKTVPVYIVKWASPNARAYWIFISKFWLICYFLITWNTDNICIHVFLATFHSGK